MATFTLTPEQTDIVEFVQKCPNNLGVVARAGAGKTSTIIEMAEALYGTRALCLAFNRGIADTMRERLPRNCTSTTLHSFGFKTWGKSIRARLEVDKYKNSRLMEQYINAVDPEERWDWDSEVTQEMPKIMAQGKMLGFVPDDVDDVDAIYDEEEFFRSIEFKLMPKQRRAIVDASKESWQEALDGKVDFDDMILCATVYRDAAFGVNPVTFVDEAQDLSALNHRMIEKIVGANRLIIVGDPFQAIYAFRGAEERSMGVLMKQFSMEERRLTVSFRCDSAIVENAQWRAPDMKWRADAGIGSVDELDAWTERDIPDDSAIICRNNAPLVDVYMNLLRAGRKPVLGNKDTLYQVLKILQSLSSDHTTTLETMFELINQWEKDAIEKRVAEDAKASMADLASTMRVICRRHATLGAAVQYMQAVVNQPGNILLSTIHKAKGLEFDHVYILDKELLAKDGQDLNLRYVAETRAKHHLRYITSEGFVALQSRDIGAL